MKDIVCLAVMLAVVCCEPKAPYLPSGWKPDGPAFLLPSEVQKPDDNPLKATIEVEASASDFLREYGPPAQGASVQALPDVATEQTFSVKSEAREETAQNQEDESNDQVENNEQQVESNVQVENKEQNVESNVQVENKEQNVKSNVQVEKKEQNVETNAQEEQTVENNENVDNSVKTANVETAAEKESETGVSANETKKEQKTQNIQEALNNLGQEISSQQVKSTERAEAKTIQQEAGVTSDSPAGFLEYGPPGFREYGPPQDIPSPFVRSSLIQEDSAAPTIAAEVLTTETRRRRFSPRLRIVRSQ